MQVFCIILLRHTIYTSKLFLTSNEDFRDRHLSYWSSSHFFEDETTNHLERKEKSFIQYWFLHIPHYNIYLQLILSVRSHTMYYSNACNIQFSLHYLYVWSTLKVRSENIKRIRKSIDFHRFKSMQGSVSSLHLPLAPKLM